MRIKIVVAYMIAGAAIAAGFYLGGIQIDPLNLIDLQGTCGLLLATLLALLNFSGRELGTALRILGGGSAGRAELADSLRVVRVIGRYQFTTAIFLWLMVLILLLFNGMIASKTVNTLGHSLALVLNTSLYLICLKLFVLMPAQTMLSRQLLRCPD
ncbi:MAG: hypothetical protein ACAI44_36535 [Candidatus Sericytochromatia bacterium]